MCSNPVEQTKITRTQVDGKSDNIDGTAANKDKYSENIMALIKLSEQYAQLDSRLSIFIEIRDIETIISSLKESELKIDHSVLEKVILSAGGSLDLENEKIEEMLKEAMKNKIQNLRAEQADLLSEKNCVQAAEFFPSEEDQFQVIPTIALGRCFQYFSDSIMEPLNKDSFCQWLENKFDFSNPEFDLYQRPPGILSKPCEFTAFKVKVNDKTLSTTSIREQNDLLQIIPTENNELWIKSSSEHFNKSLQLQVPSPEDPCIALKHDILLSDDSYSMEDLDNWQILDLAASQKCHLGKTKYVKFEPFETPHNTSLRWIYEVKIGTSAIILTSGSVYIPKAAQETGFYMIIPDWIIAKYGNTFRLTSKTAAAWAETASGKVYCLQSTLYKTSLNFENTNEAEASFYQNKLAANFNSECEGTAKTTKTMNELYIMSL